MGMSSGTGLAPGAAGMSTLSSNATGSAPSEVDLETQGARAGGKMFFMVDLRMLLFFNGFFESVAGESKRRGKLIVFFLMVVVNGCREICPMIERRGRVDLDSSAWDWWFNHDSVCVIGTRVLADGRLKVSWT